MNVIVLTGRLGNRIETKQYGSSSALNFSIAVPRPYKDKSGNYITDWFNCHSFNENIVKNVSKWYALLDSNMMRIEWHVLKLVGRNLHIHVLRIDKWQEQKKHLVVVFVLVY